MKIRQPVSGYRFSMDTVILARLAELRPHDRVLDLGTGCGVIALILAGRQPDITVFGVEIQKSQVEIAVQNVRENLLEDRVIICHQDIKTLSPDQTSGPVDLVVCNPPHTPAACGRINPESPIAISRHEINITIDGIIQAARRMLCPAGRLFMVFPAKRMAELMEHMRQNGIEPKKMTVVYTRAAGSAKRILVAGVKGGRPGITITEPLVIHGPDGAYTETARRILTP
ncbi:MAG: hypothetical protein COX19_07800 [Desulfobacterales bacterium CG23_combo_of_CG06-09_8_20_14_all_51_8]|nr:MAG: hypothetical protein COX19_07800 [Desulfobacterales bacterium CG23_combo_of_CG06-09_8_20_14_all_51_8]